MLNINETAVFLSNENVLSNINWNYTSELERLKTKYYDGFKSGVKCAQRWISVEDEFPNADEEANGLSKVVIAKCEDLADEVSAYYNIINKDWRTYPTGLIIRVTHWRPIELK